MLEQDQIDALAECGSVAVSPLVNALSSSNAQVVYEATNVLYAIGPDATQAVPKLVEILLNHPKADNREYAALALQSIQPSDRATIDALLQAFEQDLSSSVRHLRVMSGLALFGTFKAVSWDLKAFTALRRDSMLFSTFSY